MKSTGQPLEWTEAVRVEGSPARSRFLESHVELVRYAALRLAARLPVSVELDDLMHDGVIGLLDAVEKFDPKRGVLFRTYAERRVRGAMQDALRRRDWRPRTLRRNKRQLDDAMNRLGSLHGRAATEEELASAMGCGVSRLRQLIREANSGTIVPLDQIPNGSEPALRQGAQQPQSAMEQKQLFESLAGEIERLPVRERQVLQLYYYEELNMKEVGAVMGVTESRVCQLHAQAAARLRAALNEQLMAPQPTVSAGSTRGTR